MPEFPRSQAPPIDTIGGHLKERPMYRSFTGSVAVLLLSLVPHASPATPLAPKPVVTVDAPVTRVAEGWWEREHRDDARDRYWKLAPEKRRQYDRLQAKTKQRDEERRGRAIQEQHRLLGY
jgi:hypothetical protein